MEDETIYLLAPASVPPPHPETDGDGNYPCRCGKVHSGDYAFEDWHHHNCFHRSPLRQVDPAIEGYFCCLDCGEIFWLDRGRS